MPPQLRARRQQELALRQELIFEAAEAVLAERGFHAASVDEVARRAEVSVGTLYNVFGSKESLYAALMERGIEEVREYVRERTAAAPTGLAKLHAAIDAIFAYYREHERAFRVYISGTHGLEWSRLPQLGARMAAQRRLFSADITALCRKAVREGALPRLDPHLLSLSLLGTIEAFATRWASERGKTLDSYGVGAHAVLDALAHGTPGRAARPTAVRAIPRRKERA